MGDQATLPPGSTRAVLSDEETAALFRAYRDGGPSVCPRCAISLALSVDGANSYRLVCTGCGTCSPWFQLSPDGRLSRSSPRPYESRPPGAGS